MSLKRLSPVLIATAFGVLFSLVLNAGTIRAFVRGSANLGTVGVAVGSADETYYFAAMRQASLGHGGNASFVEHRDDSSVGGYGTWVQGLAMRLIGLDLLPVVIAGDFVFPALIAGLIFLIFFHFMETIGLALLAATAFMGWWDVGLLRSVSPQITMLPFLLSLLLFATDRTYRHAWVRGVLLLLTFLCQPLFGTYLVVLEIFDALTAWWFMPLRTVVKRRLPLAIGVVAYGLASLMSMHATDSVAIADTYRRRGLILSHLPAAPTLLCALLLLLPIHRLGTMFTKHRPMRHAVSCMLLAGVVVLSQAVLHGHDAIFGLYYRVPLMLVIALALVCILLETGLRTLARPVLAIYAGAYLFSFLATLLLVVPRAEHEAHAFADSDIPAAVESLRSHTGTLVVLAPIEVENMVPLFTKHGALFTQYARYDIASDQELAERYLLQQAVFPVRADLVQEGHPLVFGLYGGNMYAKTKTVCALWSGFGFAKEGCGKNLSDFIYHQDVRSLVESGTIDVSTLLGKYGVTTVISDKPLPAVLKRSCKKSSEVGAYAIYDCAF